MPARPRRILFCLCTLLIIFPGLAKADSGFFNLVRSRIEQQVRPNDLAEGFLCRGEPICGVNLIPSFYAARHFSPVWLDSNGLRPCARDLVSILETIDQEGLRPPDYHLDSIDRVVNQLSNHPFPADDESAVAWADLDLLLTDAFLLMAAHLSGGRINPETLHPDWIINQRSVDLLTMLEAASSGAPMVEAIKRLRPGHAGYLGLRQALAGLRKVEADGGWPPVEGSETLHPQDADPQAIALRQRLGKSTDAEAQDSSDDLTIYDQDLVTAVKAFQKSHGLDPDGVVGRKTRAAMNVGIKERIRQVELNLERWPLASRRSGGTAISHSQHGRLQPSGDGKPSKSAGNAGGRRAPGQTNPGIQRKNVLYGPEPLLERTVHDCRGRYSSQVDRKRRLPDPSGYQGIFRLERCGG